MFNFFKRKGKNVVIEETAEEIAEQEAEENPEDLSQVTLKKEERGLSTTVEFLSWIQEFSKKVVTVTFFVYIVAMIFSLIMIAVEFYISLDAAYLDTFISELNQTFRDVIGGYLLKAATENVIKIGGGYMESYMSSKTTIIEQKVATVAGTAASSMNSEPIEPEEEDFNPQNRG